MREQTISVSQAASQLGVSVHTVRRWCKDFSEYLSDRANPETGKERRLSMQDLAVLSEVSRFRSDGLSVPLIRERLNETVFPAPIIESSQDAQDAPGTALQVVQPLIDEQRRVAALVASLEEKIKPLDNQRLRVDVVWIAVTAFLAGLAVGLAVWLFQ